MDKKKYYITTAIAYTSGKPHIGNTYEVVLADSIARFKRAQGYDVFFQTERRAWTENRAQGRGSRDYASGVCGQCGRGDPADLGSDEHLL